MTNSAFATGGVDPTFNAGATNFYFQTVETIAVRTDEPIPVGDNLKVVKGIRRNRIAGLNAVGTLDASFNPPGGANESNLKFIRRARATNTEFTPTSFVVAANTLTLNNVNNFSDLMLGNNLAPTAASVLIGGCVKTESGRGVHRVQISLTDAAGNTRYAMTNAFGFYRFTNVQIGETYLFNIRHKQYDFLQPSFLLFVTEERTDINFTAQPRKEGIIYDAFNRNFEDTKSMPPAQEDLLENRVEALRSLATLVLREVESMEKTVPSKSADIAGREFCLYDEIQRYEADLIRNALIKTHGRQRQAARRLSIKVMTLNAKIQRYDINWRVVGIENEFNA